MKPGEGARKWRLSRQKAEHYRDLIMQDEKMRVAKIILHDRTPHGKKLFTVMQPHCTLDFTLHVKAQSYYDVPKNIAAELRHQGLEVTIEEDDTMQGTIMAAMDAELASMEHEVRKVLDGYQDK